jgi:hypothetical protein
MELLGRIGRILGFTIVGLLVVLTAAYFLTPSTASRSSSFTVERPAASVLARLASTPAGAEIAEGVTVTGIESSDEDTVVGNVAYANGATGKVTFTVAPEGEATSVNVKLEQNLGPNPLNRYQAFTGGEVGPLLAATSTALTADLTALPTASFTGLAYSVEQAEARPFFYIQNCAPTDAEAVTDVVAQSLLALRPIMARQNLVQAGPPIAVEPRVENNQYCYQIGYPYTGRPPRVLAVGAAGNTPAGTVLRMSYSGTEENVLAEVYNRMDALLAAAHLDDPSTQEDDWTTYEVYHDDPTQPGGSRSRDIYYVAQGDIAALTRIAPPTAPAAEPAAAAPAADPAAAPATPAPAAAATTPAPATTP